MPRSAVLLLSTSDTDLITARASGSDYRWANPSRLVPGELDELLDGQLLEAVDSDAWTAQLRERVLAAQHGGQPDVERQMAIVRVIDTGPGLGPGPFSHWLTAP